jgi:hypothetical protein
MKPARKADRMIQSDAPEGVLRTSAAQVLRVLAFAQTALPRGISVSGNWHGSG